MQFHPEVHHTPNGKTLYENFVKLAGFTGDWTMKAYREEAIRAIREQVGDAKVICGLSGGVDSSVAAVLIHRGRSATSSPASSSITASCGRTRPNRS